MSDPYEPPRSEPPELKDNGTGFPQRFLSLVSLACLLVTVGLSHFEISPVYELIRGPIVLAFFLLAVFLAFKVFVSDTGSTCGEFATIAVSGIAS